MVRKVLVGAACAIALLAACACKPSLPAADPGRAAAATAESAATTASPKLKPQGEYVVWVDELNMRSQPYTRANVICVLKRGETAQDLGEEAADVDGIWWRHVRAGAKEGWVADWYMLPRSYYDAFREADELGKAGQGKAMVAAAIKGGEKIGLREAGREEFLFADVSPDGMKVTLKGDWAADREDDWGGNYPGPIKGAAPFPVLTFASGKGLVDYFRSIEDISGMWSPDSRYYTYIKDPLSEVIYTATLTLLDAATGNKSDIGRLVYMKPEYADGYLLWVDEEEVPEPGPPPLEKDSATPVLRAYELATGRKWALLRADLHTLRPNEKPERGWGGTEYFSVKMVIADPCPEGVGRSKLYIKYFRNYVRAANREHFME